MLRIAAAARSSLRADDWAGSLLPGSISLTGFIPAMREQVKMTLLLAAVAVPVNTVFGIVAALQLTRSEFAGKTFAMAMLDLPFSISPVVTGALRLAAAQP